MIPTIEAAPVAFGAGDDIDFDGIPSRADLVTPMCGLSYASQVDLRSEASVYINSQSAERAKNFDLVMSSMYAAIGTLGTIGVYPVEVLNNMNARLNGLILPNVIEERGKRVIDIPKDGNGEYLDGIVFLPTTAHDKHNYVLGPSFWTPGPAWWARIESTYEKYRDAKAHETFLTDRTLVEEHVLRYNPNDFPVEPLSDGLAHMPDNRLRFDQIRYNRYSGKDDYHILRTWQGRLLCCMQMPKNSNAIPRIMSHQFAHMEQLDQDIFCDYEPKTTVKKPLAAERTRLPIRRENHALRVEQDFYHALVQADTGRYAHALGSEQSCSSTTSLVELLKRRR